MRRVFLFWGEVSSSVRKDFLFWEKVSSFMRKNSSSTRRDFLWGFLFCGEVSSSEKKFHLLWGKISSSLRRGFLFYEERFPWGFLFCGRDSSSLRKGVLSRVSSKWTKKNFGSNRNKPKQDLFRVCFGLFRETKKKIFRFVLVFRTYIERTETNRTVSKRTETIRNREDKKKKSPKTLFIIQGGSDISGTLSNLPRCIKKSTFY